MQDRQGEGAVHRAAERGHSRVVELLLSEGADANAVSYSCTSAYHLAAHNCHGTTAIALHQAGAVTDLKPRSTSPADSGADAFPTVGGGKKRK